MPNVIAELDNAAAQPVALEGVVAGIEVVLPAEQDKAVAVWGTERRGRR